MFYIHQSTCISPQQTFSNPDIENLTESAENKLKAVEPSYEGIPPGILRRMGKSVRMGVGAALPLLKEKPHGIIIGTANGGMEDSIKFLNQIIEYKEGMLTPGNFVQSTPNAIAGQLGMMSSNKGYNITHVQRALAFENAIIDADMMLKENPGATYLLGGVDEISDYNYNIEYLGGWYTKEPLSNKNLFTVNSAACIAGEGAAMFLVNSLPQKAIAQLRSIHILHTDHEKVVAAELKAFLARELATGEKIDLLITGENGDNRFLKYSTCCEAVLGRDIMIARFKHMSGEYATASAVAVWLACHILQQQQVPKHMIKSGNEPGIFKKILICNQHKGLQHSFILLSLAAQ